MKHPEAAWRQWVRRIAPERKNVAKAHREGPIQEVREQDSESPE